MSGGDGGAVMLLVGSGRSGAAAWVAGQSAIACTSPDTSGWRVVGPLSL